MSKKTKLPFKKRIKSKFKCEVSHLKKEVLLPEYIIWWAIRIWMIVLTVEQYKEHHWDGHIVTQFASNTLVLFALPLLHALPRKSKVFRVASRLSYRANTIACLFVTMGCVLSISFDWYSTYRVFDTVEHLIFGLLMVPVGYYIISALTDEKISPLIASTVGFGLSCFIALVWEFYEFTFDNINIANRVYDLTQGWNEEPSEFFQKYLPWMMNIEENAWLHCRWGLLDTMTDLSLGLAGAVLGGILLRVALEIAKKRKNKPAK